MGNIGFAVDMDELDERRDDRRFVSQVDSGSASLGGVACDGENESRAFIPESFGLKSASKAVKCT